MMIMNGGPSPPAGRVGHSPSPLLPLYSSYSYYFEEIIKIWVADEWNKTN